jgi:hypothetical protein
LEYCFDPQSDNESPETNADRISPSRVFHFEASILFAFRGAIDGNSKGKKREGQRVLMSVSAEFVPFWDVVLLWEF